MSTPSSHDVLTSITSGMPMNVAFSRYWWPILLSTDLPPAGSSPRRVTLLHKAFVAFRDRDSRVGLLDERCCHRSASLCLGRVETDGIRCIYHGWKYDVAGRVVDLPPVKDPRLNPVNYPSSITGTVARAERWTRLLKASLVARPEPNERPRAVA